MLQRSVLREKVKCPILAWQCGRSEYMSYFIVAPPVADVERWKHADQYRSQVGRPRAGKRTHARRPIFPCAIEHDALHNNTRLSHDAQIVMSAYVLHVCSCVRSLFPRRPDRSTNNSPPLLPTPSLRNTMKMTRAPPVRRTPPRKRPRLSRPRQRRPLPLSLPHPPSSKLRASKPNRAARI